MTLTVTDALGAVSTSTQSIVVRGANQLPVAQFTSRTDRVTVSLDGRVAADADGTIASYSWAFGDGATGSGARADHTYAGAGTYQVTLTVTDDRGGSASITRAVTVELPPNAVPAAAFTKSMSDLSVVVDGSGSTDSDGTIVSYAWAFGDGGTASGVSASHVYAAAGAYTVVLTVTDDRGGVATSSTVVDVVVSNVLVDDSFERTLAGSWGSAPKGGAWSLSGTASRFSVADGAGSVVLSTSATQAASLAGVSSTSTRLSARFMVDKIANAQYISFIGRQVGTEQYLLRARIAADGSVILHVMRGGTAIGAGYTVPGLTVVPGMTYTAMFEVTGSGPTALNAKVWKAAGAEPGAWQITRTDSTAVLQGAGGIGVSSFVPTSANAYPVRVSFSDISAIDPAVTATPPNQKPTAAVTGSSSDLSATFDASGSSDPDGVIASYAWTYGDGAVESGTAPNATHVYAVAGTYTVTVTVTDDRGAQSTATKEFVATAPPANQAPLAAFTTGVTGLAVTVDGSTSSDPDGTIASYAWSFGDGGTAAGVTANQTYAAAGTYTVTLTVTDDKGSTSAKTADVVVIAPPVAPAVLAQDLFERAGTGGWGSADQGGSWTITGSAGAFSVGGGAGVIALTNSTTQTASLRAVSTANAKVTTTFSLDKIAAGQYVNIVGRQGGERSVCAAGQSRRRRHRNSVHAEEWRDNRIRCACRGPGDHSGRLIQSGVPGHRRRTHHVVREALEGRGYGALHLAGQHDGHHRGTAGRWLRGAVGICSLVGCRLSGRALSPRGRRDRSDSMTASRDE